MARFVVTCSAYNQRYLTEIASSSVQHIYNIHPGVKREVLVPGRPIGSIPSSPPLILAVARLVEKKGLSYLLHACRLLVDQGHDFTCRIVGDGLLRQTLEDEIEKLELTNRVRLWGAATHQEVIVMYQEAAITALPCIITKNGDRDGLPSVLVEALCMGVPVVSTSVSGIPELIESEANGLLVPPQDSAALAFALTRLLDNPSLRYRLAIAGQQTVHERFDMTKNTKCLLDLLCAQGEIEL
jgi:glycosyltransferase involved in cell wall biosynthesis